MKVDDAKPGEVVFAFTLVAPDAERSYWGISNAHMHQEIGLFETEAERDLMIAAAVAAARFVARSCFTQDEAGRIRDSGIRMARVVNNPDLMRRAVELLEADGAFGDGDAASG